ncbi:MAG: hypothetical protein PHU25_00985 [Deltaproteobacteria bacterium]|nr:hypothetical protein [Deltaproteobacteria bacterium]
MILNGPRLLVSPARAWPAAVGSRERSPLFLLGAGLTAAVWPAIAVVGGHLGSALLGVEEGAIAVQRAAVGLVAAAGGALVAVPAMTLVLAWAVRMAHEDVPVRRLGPAAMGVVWPAWTAGLVLAFPPLFGLGPELGELLWLVAAAVVAARTLRAAASPKLGIRRRWTVGFMARSTLAFVLLFAAIPIVPALAMRAALGVSTVYVPPAPPEKEWPVPPDPTW